MNRQELDEYYDRLHAELGIKYNIDPYIVNRIRSAVSRGWTQDMVADQLRKKYIESKRWKNLKATATHLQRLKAVTRMDESTWEAITIPDEHDLFLGKQKTMETTLKVESNTDGGQIVDRDIRTATAPNLTSMLGRMPTGMK